MDKAKRFEDWECVDCNECARYWDSSCDGVQKGSQKLCNSFLATRSVIIPQKLNDVQRSIQRLRVCLVIMGATIVLNTIFQIMGWL
jgi:hypothetical protein